jgi:putative flippase GtrA
MVNQKIVLEKFSLAKNRFLRFQLTALIATTIDFFMTIFLKEKINMFYSLAVAGGATAGAFTAFTINRYWVFHSVERHPVGQGIRYMLVAAGSIFLNTIFTYMITEAFQINYLVSKAIISLTVGFTYSYYFSKRFVFYA